MLVLVTGASGAVGSAVVTNLVDAGVAVRRLDRRPVPPRTGVESVRGDLADHRSVRAALHDVDTVFLIWPLGDVAAAPRLVAELAAAGTRVVYLSSSAIDDHAIRQSDAIVRMHADMEELLGAADVRLTVLRSDTLASNSRAWAGQLRVGNVVRGIDMPRTAVVDERDVAAAAAAVVRGIDMSVPSPYLLTGPTPMSRAEQVAILGSVLERPLSFEAIPADAAHSRLLGPGRPRHLVDALIDASLHRPESTLVTDHVRLLTGRPARTFRRWASDNREVYA